MTNRDRVRAVASTNSQAHVQLVGVIGLRLSTFKFDTVDSVDSVDTLVVGGGGRLRTNDGTLGLR